ncbi:MAG TPA: HEAT repeat domain-containing protein [Pyrinomonadaceae bacterium]|nr:HEAT repeat domain-containing protein [Pyrinomonadaceae bacterium]
MPAMITKASDVKHIIGEAIRDPRQSFPTIMGLASSGDWKEREVAATILVEASRKKSDEVVAEMLCWADHPDPNVRRAASEGLRGVARRSPELALPVLTKLKSDPNTYVKKSVANVLRNAGNYHPEFVLKVCEEWSVGASPHTAWIIKGGLRKLKGRYAEKVEEIVAASSPRAA